MNYYFLWYSDDWMDYPDIPCVEKFVHNLGTVLSFAPIMRSNNVLVNRFANDK